MKKNIPVALCCSALTFFVTAKALAVWPPATTLKSEPTPEVIETIDTSTMTASERLAFRIQKLEEDQRRLEMVVRNLKKDQEAFAKLVQNTTGESK